MLPVRYQRANPEEHQRENYVGDNAVAEKWKCLGIALNQAGKVLGIRDVSKRPYGEVTGQEETNTRAQPRAKNVQGLDAIA